MSSSSFLSLFPTNCKRELYLCHGFNVKSKGEIINPVALCLENRRQRKNLSSPLSSARNIIRVSLNV